jgi:Leucine rich repeat variant
VSRADLGLDLLLVHLLSDDGVREVAVRHPNMAPQAREEVRALQMGQPVDEHTLAKFLHTSARSLVVAHPEATADHLHVAASDSAWTIREAVAEHHRCGSEDLEVLARDHDRDVRAAVAANSGTPVDVLRTLLDDPDPRVRRAAASNQRALADRGSVFSLARQKALLQALRSSRPVIRAVALLDPSVPLFELRRPRHGQSIAWIERFAVAQHDRCPADIRERLIGDANRLVSAAAQGTLRWP